MTTSIHAAEETAIETPAAWLRLVSGFVLVFACFQATAFVLRSDRGQAGLLVGIVVIVATLAAERWLFGVRARKALISLGLGMPSRRGMLAAAGAGIILVLVLPAFSLASGAELTLLPNAALLLPGLFLQAGVAEEVLFRGFLFGRLRVGRSFWRAATLSLIPFTLAHLYLFLLLPWPLALASVALAAITSIPLAYLFVIGGSTIWAPALLHFVIQGAIKIVAVPPQAAMALPMIWIAAGALISFLVFLAPRVPEPRPAIRGGA